MNASILSYIGGAASIGLACFVFLRSPKSPVHQSFAGGMIALGIASLLAGLSIEAHSGARAAQWQNLRFLAQSCMSVFWLLFSLAYARIDSLQFIKRWKPAIGLACLLPLIVIFCNARAIPLFKPENHPNPTLLHLSIVGYFLQIYYLIAVVAIGFNLERTLRASVGTKRWQIKYMIIGLGLILGLKSSLSLRFC